LVEVVVGVGAVFATTFSGTSMYLGGGISSNLTHLTGRQYLAHKLLITNTAIAITIKPKQVNIDPAKNTVA